MWAKARTTGTTGRKALLLLLGDIASEHGVLWAGVDYLADILAPIGDRRPMEHPAAHPVARDHLPESLSRNLQRCKSDGAKSQPVDPRSQNATQTVSRTDTDSSGANAPSPTRSGENDREAARLCRLLADLMLGNDAKAKIPEQGTATRDRWKRDMRLLIKDRGGVVDEVELVIRWCQADEFEQTNVLSPSKLRKRFSQLWLKAQRADPLAGLSSPSNVVPIGWNDTNRPAALRKADRWRAGYPSEAAQ
jgi:hypothetical protein